MPDPSEKLGIDAHCHLDRMEDPLAVIEQARKENMAAVVTSVADPEDAPKALEILKGNEDIVKLCLGFHPHSVGKYTEKEIQAYEQLIAGERFDIVGIGEIGLEYRQGNAPAEDQQRIFTRFGDLAAALHKPIVIHCREAWHDVLRICAERKWHHVIFHCFSGSESDIKAICSRSPDWYISFATNATYTKKHPRLIEKTPLNHMLLETDAPWLDPDHPPGTEQKLENRPWKIRRTAELIAGIKGLPVGEILRITTDNARRIFGI